MIIFVYEQTTTEVMFLGIVYFNYDMFFHIVGQALIIFKTREAAQMVVGKLNEGCLLLSNGRLVR